MPVIDHPVHPITREAEGARYGCHNRPPFAPGYWVKETLYLDDGKPRQYDRFIPHTMSTGCRFDMSLRDRKCADCQHAGSGERYNETIRENES